MSTVVYVVLAVVAGLAFAIFLPDLTQRTIEFVVKARKITSAVIFGIFAFLFIGSGVDVLVAIGVVMLMFAAGRAWFMREELGVA